MIMAKRRIVLKGKVTPFNRCIRSKTKGRKFGTRAKQRAAWKKAVKSCSKRR